MTETFDALYQHYQTPLLPHPIPPLLFLWLVLHSIRKLITRLISFQGVSMELHFNVYQRVQLSLDRI